VSSLTEVLDLNTMTFTRGPKMFENREGCVAVALDSRRILVIGGAFLKTSEILDVDTLTLTPGPSMHFKRRGCAAVSLDAKRLLVVGGEESASLASSEILDLQTMAFTPGPTMRSARDGCSAVRLDAHRCLVVGGRNVGERNVSALSSTEVLDIASMTFTVGPNMATARYGCSAAPLGSRQILVVGGKSKSHQSGSEVSQGPTHRSFLVGCFKASEMAPCLRRRAKVTNMLFLEKKLLKTLLTFLRIFHRFFPKHFLLLFPR
jgi:hypothetical protein